MIRNLYGKRVADELIPVTSSPSPEKGETAALKSEATRLAVDRLGLRFNGLLTNPNKITSGKQCQTDLTYVKHCCFTPGAPEFFEKITVKL